MGDKFYKFKLQSAYYTFTGNSFVFVRIQFRVFLKKDISRISKCLDFKVVYMDIFIIETQIRFHLNLWFSRSKIGVQLKYMIYSKYTLISDQVV